MPVFLAGRDEPSETQYSAALIAQTIRGKPIPLSEALQRRRLATNLRLRGRPRAAP
jgi:hypothetical protein